MMIQSNKIMEEQFSHENKKYLIVVYECLIDGETQYVVRGLFDSKLFGFSSYSITKTECLDLEKLAGQDAIYVYIECVKEDIMTNRWEKLLEARKNIGA